MIPYFLHVHTEHHIPTGIPDALLDALTESIGICALVILMMILIEIFNVVTKGRLFRGLENHRFAQICTSSALGFIPGCLGGFAGVSLYSHRMVGFGALMATLVATTGDEARGRSQDEAGAVCARNCRRLCDRYFYKVNAEEGKTSECGFGPSM